MLYIFLQERLFQEIKHISDAVVFFLLCVVRTHGQVPVVNPTVEARITNAT